MPASIAPCTPSKGALPASAVAENDALFAAWQGQLLPGTLAVYTSRMRVLSTALGVSVGCIMRDPMRYIALLHARSGSLGSERNLVKTLLSLFKYNSKPGARIRFRWLHGEAAKEAHMLWRTHHAGLGAKELLRAMQNKPTSERQLDNYVGMDEVKEKLEELLQDPARHEQSKNSMQVLLLSILEHMPPMRADLGHIEVFKRHVPEVLKAPYLIAEDGMRLCVSAAALV